MADFGGGELEGFRTEARTWLEANFPPSLAHKPELILEAMNRREKPTGDVALWRQRMGEKGWGTPTWPQQYGGGGLTQAEARVLGDPSECPAIPIAQYRSSYSFLAPSSYAQNWIDVVAPTGATIVV